MMREDLIGILIGAPLLVCLVVNIGPIFLVLTHPVTICAALAVVFMGGCSR